MSYVAIGGRLARQLEETLRAAFTPHQLERLLAYSLDRRLVDITMAGDYTTVVFKVIEAAVAENWLSDLVAAARRERPRVAELQSIAEELGVAPVTTHLERAIREHVPDLDSSVWLARLARLEGQVCRVERRDPAGPVALGTGFLIGPDLCMTSHHVVRELRGQPAVLRFDFRRDRDGRVVNPGVEHSLAADPLLASLPGSPVDLLTEPGDRVPERDQLDVAVLRVAGAPGADEIGLDGVERGWVSAVAVSGIASDDQFVLLHHPAGEPLRISLGQVIGVNRNGTRVRHKVTTAGGSSGAPCFNAAWELVAVHQAGDPRRDTVAPEYNTAVPILAVRAQLGLP